MSELSLWAERSGGPEWQEQCRCSREHGPRSGACVVKCGLFVTWGLEAEYVVQFAFVIGILQSFHQLQDLHVESGVFLLILLR